MFGRVAFVADGTNGYLFFVGGVISSLAGKAAGPVAFTRNGCGHRVAKQFVVVAAVEREMRARAENLLPAESGHPLERRIYILDGPIGGRDDYGFVGLFDCRREPFALRFSLAPGGDVDDCDGETGLGFGRIDSCKRHVAPAQGAILGFELKLNPVEAMHSYGLEGRFFIGFEFFAGLKEFGKFQARNAF